MMNMISADNAAVLAANNGADLSGRPGRAKPRRAGARFRNGAARGKPEIARRLAAVNHGKMNLRAVAAEAGNGNGAARENSRALMANIQVGAAVADSASGNVFGSMAAAGDSAGDNNAQLTAILAGIQQSLELSRQDMKQGRKDMAKALNAISARLGNQRGCGCCCCGGGNNAGSVGCNVVYVVCGDYKYGGKAALVSYHRPLSSQAEADAVDVIVYLGGNEDPQDFCGSDREFTLDGFTMPGNLPMDLATNAVNSYPCIFLRKQDRSGWIPLTRRDVVNSDTGPIVSVSSSYLLPEYEYGKSQLCCGLFEHNCRGKTFYVRIDDGGYWTEEQKKRRAILYLRKDNISYESFPEYVSPEIDYFADDDHYTELEVSKDCGGWMSTWGDLIEKYGDKPFGVCVFADDDLPQGIAFEIN